MAIIGPASIRLFAENGEFFSIVITEEEQHEDFKIDVKGKKAQNVHSEFSNNFKILPSSKTWKFSEKKFFWNSIYSETFYPPPEHA